MLMGQTKDKSSIWEMEATTGTGTEKELFKSTGTTDSFIDVSYYPTATMKRKIERYVIGCLWVVPRKKGVRKNGRREEV